MNDGGFSSASGTVAASSPAASNARSVCSVSCSDVIPVVVSIRRASSEGSRRGGVTRGRAAGDGLRGRARASLPFPLPFAAFLPRPASLGSGGDATAFGGASG